MKKVGLVTYYGDNYGGVLQAYALQTLVMTNGFDCELISNEFLAYRSRMKKLKAKLENLTSAIRNPSQYLEKRKTYQQYAAQNAERAKRFRAFRQEYLQIYKTGYAAYEDYLKNPPQYDVYLCGSDCNIWCEKPNFRRFLLADCRRITIRNVLQ